MQVTCEYVYIDIYIYVYIERERVAPLVDRISGIWGTWVSYDLPEAMFYLLQWDSVYLFSNLIERERERERERYIYIDCIGIGTQRRYDLQLQTSG